MFNLIEWFMENIYHTTSCDKERRILGNKCICGKDFAIRKVQELEQQREDLLAAGIKMLSALSSCAPDAGDEVADAEKASQQAIAKAEQ